ncbi:hypothetical protein WICMUC_005555 [Wickerhamomyces mucosus]|uniref:Protein kinase domain-containing protein n=1 Tax=Wickerhamomyces mucosus TaxID=1378264 RepID=A0A9P8T666_9ASCO|nr:hypothetical protein WICMUC_005555 [Wickerhamomyces mucosus]
MVLGTEVIKREADLSCVVRVFLKTILEFINTIKNTPNGRLEIESAETRNCILVNENFEAYEASRMVTSENLSIYKRGITHGPLEYKLMIIPDLVIKNAGVPIIPIELKCDKYLNKRYLEYKEDLTSHDVLNEKANFQKEFLTRHRKILEYFQQSISQMITYNSMISILTNGISWIILRDDKQFSEKPFAFTLTQQQRTSKTEVGLLLENYFTMIILQVHDVKFNQKLIATIMQQIDSNSIMNMKNQSTEISMVKQSINITNRRYLRNGLLSFASAEFSQQRYFVLMMMLKPYLVQGADDLIKKSFSKLKFSELQERGLMEIARKIDLQPYHREPSLNFLKKYISINEIKGIEFHLKSEIDVRAVIQSHPGGATIIRAKSSLSNLKKKVECLIKIYDPVRMAFGNHHQTVSLKKDVYFTFEQAVNIAFNNLIKRELSCYHYLKNGKSVKVPKLLGLHCIIPSQEDLMSLTGGILPINDLTNSMVAGLALEYEFISECFEQPQTKDELEEYCRTLMRKATIGLLEIHSLFGLHRDLHPGNIIIHLNEVYFIDFEISLRLFDGDEKLPDDIEITKYEMSEEFEKLLESMSLKIFGFIEESDTPVIKQSRFSNFSTIAQALSEIMNEVHSEFGVDQFILNSAGSDIKRD